MRVANPQMLCPGVADTRAAIVSAPGNSERPRVLAAHITKAVRREDLISLAKTVIHTDIKRILIIDDILIREIVVSKRRRIGWLRIEIRHRQPDRIETTPSCSTLSRRPDTRRNNVVRDRLPQQDRFPTRTRIVRRFKRIENRARIERVGRTPRCTGGESTARQPIAKVSVALGW